ncbi:hypothetical protein PMAYCL1PPCAC_01097, partial [Pristionchus mayeri]
MKRLSRTLLQASAPSQSPSMLITNPSSTTRMEPTTRRSVARKLITQFWLLDTAPTMMMVIIGSSRTAGELAGAKRDTSEWRAIETTTVQSLRMPPI